jgi:hypothetical protein
MNTDRYTKAVLTVIAGCLLWICAMGTGPSLAAQPAASLAIPNATVQPVVIVGTGTLDQKGTVTVRYMRQPDGSPPRTDPTLPVTLPYTAAKPLPVGLPYTVDSPLPAQVINMGGAPLPVEISAVRKTADWDPIRVRVEPGTQSARPGGGGQ